MGPSARVDLHDADEPGLRRAEHEVARILAETERPVEVYARALDAIGRSLGWDVGAVWELDRHDGHLHCVCHWTAGEGAESFAAASELITLAPGEGLPGRVLATGTPTWLTQATTDPNFPRADAARDSGLSTGVAFPLRSARGVLGVMELFASSQRDPDEPTLVTLTVLGSQIAQYVARRHAEAEVRARESRLRAILETALDAVISIDADGRVTGWNNAATVIFGYGAEEAMGRDMAELIVPPRHRDAHRRGLARFRATERPVVLDSRLELTGRRRDGTEFPVELTITRIPLPGPPTFTGYLRDITDRRRAVEELRASRARLVAVADVERRRIQANLHDGAQQRLTSALIMLGRVSTATPEDQALLRQAGDELAAGLKDIRELARGLHPSLLSERGLAAALQALALRSPLPVELEAVPDRRLSEQVEAAAYYVVAEALANVQKHAGPCRAAVRAVYDDGALRVEVEDDGAGGADRGGNGLRGLADRVEALDGRLELESPVGRGTLLRAAIPA